PDATTDRRAFSLVGDADRADVWVVVERRVELLEQGIWQIADHADARGLEAGNYLFNGTALHDQLLSPCQLDVRITVERDAFVFEHALNHRQVPSNHLRKALDRIVLEVERELGEAFNVAVTRTHDQGLDPAVEDCAAAHRAWLAGAVEHAIWQRALLELLRRVFDRQRFRMGGGVGRRNLQAARAHNDLPVARDDRAKRLLAHGSPQLLFLDGDRHEALVISVHTGSLVVGKRQ